MDKTVLIPIANGTEEMEAVIVADMLRRAGISVKIAGDNEIVTCSRGVKIIPDIMLDELDIDDSYSAIVIPGGLGGVENLMKHETLDILLRKHIQAGAIVGAICAAPMLLARKKMLPDGIEITSHPSVRDFFDNYIYAQENVVIENNIITSRGAGTAFEFALTLIAELAGEDYVRKISKDILLSI